MVRPYNWLSRWLGTHPEIEGFYQSTIGYGIVDVVSSSCAFMTSADGCRRGCNTILEDQGAQSDRHTNIPGEANVDSQAI